MHDKNIFISQYFKNMFNLKMIDSFRPKYSNAHIILKELLDVCELIKKDIIKSWYLPGLLEETLGSIKKDIFLNKNDNIQRRNILLNELTLYKIQSEKNKNIEYLIQFLKSELRFLDKVYFDFLKEEIFLISDRRKSIKYTNQDIRELLNSFVSECIFLGISFRSLKVLSSLEENYSKIDIKKIINKISSKKEFNFYLILCGVNEVAENFFIELFNRAENPHIYIYKKGENDRISKKILKKRKISKYIIIEVKKRKFFDNYGGALEVRGSLEPLVNLIHVFCPLRKMYFYNKGVSVCCSTRKKEIETIDYINVVDYKPADNKEIIKMATDCFELPSNIREKIFSSASYLDISLNEFNIINKYLNAWISIEIIFNTIKNDSGDENGKTFNYINEFVPKILSIFYISKIINFLFERFLNLKLDINKEFIAKKGSYDITSFLEYLKEKENRKYLKEQLCKQHELRETLFHYINILFDNKKLLDLLNCHTKKISFHLQRLYRLRNVLVHGGERNIETEGLYNISSISMLCINCQEYAMQLIKYISEVNISLPKEHRNDLTMFSFLNLFSLIYDKMIYKLDNEDFNFDDLKKILSPIDFIK